VAARLVDICERHNHSTPTHRYKTKFEELVEKEDRRMLKSTKDSNIILLIEELHGKT